MEASQSAVQAAIIGDIDRYRQDREARLRRRGRLTGPTHGTILVGARISRPTRALYQQLENHRMREHLENLEDKVDELVALCSALDKENRSLRGRENDWQNERRQLLIKNENARSKVEAMISRLKSMESGE